MDEVPTVEVWDRATDPSLPDGVVAFQDGDGNWWRYPLVEFADERAEKFGG